MIFNKSFFLNSILVFFIIFDVSFAILPALTSARIILLFFLIRVNFSNTIKLKFSNNIIVFLSILFLLFIGSIIQYINSNDFIQSSRLLWFSIYSIITPYLLSKHFSNLKEFLSCFLFSTFIQSVIAIFSFFNPAVKQSISSLIVVGGNDLDEAIYRAISFSGSSGAALSVIQFCGVYSGLFLLTKYSFSKLNCLFIWIGLIFSLLSTLIIGRTGLICSLFAVIIFSISQFNFKKLFYFLTIVILISQINFLSILETQTESIPGFKVDFFLNWIEEAFTVKDNNTANAINEMPVPPLNFNTILGTGEIFNYDTMRNSSGNDSGYIQTYFSLGIILAFVFYFSYFLFLILQIGNKNKFFIFILISLLFLIEIKEPFMFKYMFSFFVFSFILLSKKDEMLCSETY